ncbi:K-like proteiny domain [Sesbania bispinosa]|nr:K-like proteiny domain [Sesbania bispinosa]
MRRPNSPSGKIDIIRLNGGGRSCGTRSKPCSLDCKRKFEDLQPEPTEQQPLESNSNADGENTDAAVPDEGENKRPRLDDNGDDLANANGHQDEQVAEPGKESGERSTVERRLFPRMVKLYPKIFQSLLLMNKLLLKLATLLIPKSFLLRTLDRKNADEPSKETQQPSNESTEQDASPGEKQSDSVDPASHSARKQPTSGAEVTTRKIEVPNNKCICVEGCGKGVSRVGVLIGKAGDTIRYLQYNSGAKIQITRDADADPHSATRPVELIGTLESIDKAEKLMSAVIAEADAGGSPSLVARGLSPAQVTVGSEQIQIQVPNEKVGLIIGRGGETIKALQTKSGARIQLEDNSQSTEEGFIVVTLTAPYLIPQHLPEGDDSKERTVQVTGDKRQIEVAQELIKEVMSQERVIPGEVLTSDDFNFIGVVFLSRDDITCYRSCIFDRPAVFYFLSQSTGGLGIRPTAHLVDLGGPPQWGQRGLILATRQRMITSIAVHILLIINHMHHHMEVILNICLQGGSYGSGWEQRPHHSLQGPPPHNGGYEYYGGQGGHLSDAPPSTQLPSSVPSHGTGPSPVPSMGPSPAQVNYNYGQPQGQNYGHHAPYTQAGLPQQGYGQGYDESKYDNHAPTQHPYGGHVNSQQTYSQAGAQPNFAALQQYGSTPAQSYGTNMPMQQPYPYASSGTSQAAYPTYGSAPAADGAQPAASYAQVGPTGYGSYPSQQTYPEQPAANNAVYGYQAPQDPAYSSAAAPAYSAAPSGQPGYVQTRAYTTGYEQSNPQSAGYAAVPASAPAAYGKTLSPQPAYPQYDSTKFMVLLDEVFSTDSLIIILACSSLTASSYVTCS